MNASKGRHNIYLQYLQRFSLKYIMFKLSLFTRVLELKFKCHVKQTGPGVNVNWCSASTNDRGWKSLIGSLSVRDVFISSTISPVPS